MFEIRCNVRAKEERNQYRTELKYGYMDVWYVEYQQVWWLLMIC